MDVLEAKNLGAILTSVAEYGGQLAKVFHNYVLIAETIPSGFEGGINILDSTVAVLKQVLDLIKDEAEGKKLFSEEGLTYVQLLTKECAVTLAKIEPFIRDACLDRKDRKAKLKQKKKDKKSVVDFNPLALKLDEKDFLEKVEITKWRLAFGNIEKCLDRLYELQLHLLLVFEVVQIGALSKDLSSGKVEISRIIHSCDRIYRTTELLGIRAPNSLPLNNRLQDSFSSSDSDSSSSRSSEREASFVDMKKKKKFVPFSREQSRPRPPPGPPLSLVSGRVFGAGGPPPPPNAPSSFITTLSPPPKVEEGIIIIDGTRNNTAKPPAYSETRPGVNAPPPAVPVIVPQMNNMIPSKPVQCVYSNEKAGLKSKDEPANTKDVAKPVIAEGRLFKSPSKGFGFKLRALFQSKATLAAEMRTTLSNFDSHLMAFVVQRHDFRQVPHSAFHALETTHMKTILSQLNGNDWYKTFSNLDSYEHVSIARLLHPVMNGKAYERELVVLKVLEQNRLNIWMALLGELLRNPNLGHLTNGRVLLAIVREKFVNGKPIHETYPPLIFPTRPPAPPLHPPVVGPKYSVRPPPMPYNPPIRSIISDLDGPPLQISIWPAQRPPLRSPPRGPLSGPSFPGNSMDSGNGARKVSTSTNDGTPNTEVEAFTVLTTYNEYTMRLAGKPDNAISRTWSRVFITQENSENQLLLHRVEQFKLSGINVIEAKLRMTEMQSGQLTRLMDHLKCSESDDRFEWTWVEISLYNDAGEITHALRSGIKGHDLDTASAANRMHLIAKRSLRASYKALDVFNAIMKPAPPPPQPINNLPTIIHLPSSKERKSSTVVSDSDTSYYSSDSSIGNVRRRLRSYRAKKARENRKRIYDDSDSQSDTENEDHIAVNVVLKRGEDVLTALLGKWTPESGLKGKGKGKLSLN